MGQNEELKPGQDYYDQNYPDYEAQNSPAKLSFYLARVKAHTPEGGSLFELGTGLGNFLRLASETYSCQGCDPNPFAVETTQAKVPTAQLYTGSFETMPNNHQIDTVVSWDVLEHIPQLDEALATVNDRLKNGGHLIGVVPVYDGPLGFLVRALDHDPTHVWKESRHWWLEKLVAGGFEVVESGGILRKLLTGKRYLHWTRPQWLWRGCGCALYFAAKKTNTHNRES